MLCGKTNEYRTHTEVCDKFEWKEKSERCKNCLREYTPVTDATHEGFCSSTCKYLYEAFDIERIRKKKLIVTILINEEDFVDLECLVNGIDSGNIIKKEREQ